MKKPFKFKLFTIHQDRCAMKVGTDGVLLGATTSLEKQPDSILDIGAGTGIIALMLAQRSSAETIDAVEQDAEAHEQCVGNFEASPWSDRLFCYHASFQEFYREMEEGSYDLIVSNPPFYSENVSSGNPARDKARQNHSLPFDQLFDGVHRLLSKKGTFCLIVPQVEEEKVLGLAKQKHLFPFRVLRVKGNPSAPIKRSIMQFSFGQCNVLENELVIEMDRHQFTQEYIDLTKAFHIKM